MKKIELNWQIGYTKDIAQLPAEWLPATVPGAAQIDYAKAKGWPAFYKGVNFRQYKWMEDVYWIYTAPLNFTLHDHQHATLVFNAIDYRYQIKVGGEQLFEGEGMFSPIRCDVTRFAGKNAAIEVYVFPVPKADDSDTRDQARFSCKSAACYGWDWHPRLVSAGIWDEAYLLIEDQNSIESLDVSYTLSEDFNVCYVDISAKLYHECDVQMEILYEGEPVLALNNSSVGCTFNMDVCLEQPKLWYPTGWGKQNRYTVKVSTLATDGRILESKSRTVGFRRVKLVMNEDGWEHPEMPKPRADAPATLEINGRRIFAKGTNWVNAKVFPGEMNEAHYRGLLESVVNANMNILRIWGGGFVNKEWFYDMCDSMGIMVWQEFPLACNEYPDDDHYLEVLEREATSIVRRLRTHPCIVLWCGGNELFNSWSGMTEQHHALRLLDSVCYREDRYTPFNMTSPLNGMAHGNYLNYDEDEQEECITMFVDSNFTAYTEFGAPSMSPKEDLMLFMDEADYEDCNPENEVWREHHGFGAWRTNTWVRKPEMEYYFGGYNDLDDMIEKSLFIQAMCYKSSFEEFRRKWPRCSMALNWCYNEPWPTAGNNSLITYAGTHKPAYYAVQQALRPQIASLQVRRHLWWSGEEFAGNVWVLNDSQYNLPATDVRVYICLGDTEKCWGSISFDALDAQTNRIGGTVRFGIPQDYSGSIKIRLLVDEHPEMDSEYTYLCRRKKIVSTEGMLNV